MASPQAKRTESRQARQITSHKFPSDLGTHAMLIIFDKYDYANRRKINSTPTKVSQDSIMLPLPTNLTDPSRIRISSTELGLGGAASSGSAQIAKQLRDANIQTEGDAGAALSRILGGTNAEEILKSFGNSSMASLLQGALGAVAPNVQKGLEVGGGYSFNPYQALAFDGVDMKTFSFDWLLAPGSREETETLKNIIRSIKYHIHPDYKQVAGDSNNISSRAFFQYPDIANIFMLGSPDEYMFQFKPCMVTSFNVDYTGAGDIAFLEGGAPAVVKMSMSLSEMEVWTKEDYASREDR